MEFKNELDDIDYVYLLINKRGQDAIIEKNVEHAFSKEKTWGIY